MNTSPRSIPVICAAARFVPALLAAVLLASAARAQDPCSVSAFEALRSCRQGALSDLLLQRAKCVNLPTVAATLACDAEALRAYEEALQTCDEVNTGRLDVCTRLGGGIYQPLIDPSDFVRRIDNPLFPLVPGTTFVYETRTHDGLEHIDFAVTRNTRKILGVTCTEIRDTATVDGELSEDTFDWFAQDRRGTVWYFGELSMQFEDGRLAGIEGSWEAGKDGASPGIVMQAHPRIGDFYRQEFLIDEAEDVAGVISLDERARVPFGSFHDCLESEEFSPLDPGASEHKFYASGVGLLLEVDLVTGDRTQLIAIEHDDD